MYTLPATTGVLSGRHAVPLAPGWLALEFGCVVPAAVHPCRRRSRSEPEQEALWSLGRIDLALVLHTYDTTMKMCALMLQGCYGLDGRRCGLERT